MPWYLKFPLTATIKHLVVGHSCVNVYMIVSMFTKMARIVS